MLIIVINTVGVINFKKGAEFEKFAEVTFRKQVLDIKIFMICINLFKYFHYSALNSAHELFVYEI